tara:strand:- start:12336 stop:13379 length:1044 start_codon:yes stop_codon:yes gene_type:complete
MASKMTLSINSGNLSWSAPSNIALVKYWGKRPVQLPGNASLSFTLDKSRTLVKASWQKVDSKEVSLDFLFEGQPMPSFSTKVEKWLVSISEELHFLKNLKLKFETSNTFPHSAGIASSASSMAAMALVVGELAKEHGQLDLSESEWLLKVSHFARLGSGSASRSLFPHAATWGEVSENHGSGVKELHSVYRNFGDAILVVDSKEKAVSSTQGHALMNDHPYRELRFSQANTRVKQLLEMMQTDDFGAFASLVELEALELHALMMTSSPSFILMKPATLSIIEQVRKARASGVEVCFTLDAGPNIHLLYPNRARAQALKLVESIKAQGLLDHDQWIDDCVGSGPRKEA